MSLNSVIKYLSQQEAIDVDKQLFDECGFSVDQLMELAGLSVATAVFKSYPLTNLANNKVLVCCGPGNNGGDGLVAARHLRLFGFDPQIVYPKPGRSDLFQRLVKQCQQFDIRFVDLSTSFQDYPLIIDAIFGFSYKPPLRSEYRQLLQLMKEASDNGNSKLISVDIPSGWNVETGPPTDGETPVLNPECLISLTAPKLCASQFNGRFHWLGGRFVPPTIIKKYEINIPSYPDADQCLLLFSKNN
ncbi:yjeF N-terminal domain-containing protein-like protein [Dinothrombium tinctorium]|uniref:NAD(P)H-hydrate epimerase n=1 Tax=Dinothrombium tinctorium TaxID=1965070 RepID=A0A3S3PAS0_9ACAR|nr:yjeF N-terminal domain-containing protein-like protein [Dinothrombium tinctorium]